MTCESHEAVAGSVFFSFFVLRILFAVRGCLALCRNRVGASCFTSTYSELNTNTFVTLSHCF